MKKTVSLKTAAFEYCRQVSNCSDFTDHEIEECLKRRSYSCSQINKHIELLKKYGVIISPSLDSIIVFFTKAKDLRKEYDNSYDLIVLERAYDLMEEALDSLFELSMTNSDFKKLEL